MSSTADLPILVGPPDLLEGLARERWLDRLRACRQRLLLTWQRQGGSSGPAAAAIDQALGLTLLHRFVRDRDISGYGRLAPRTVCLTPYDGSGRLFSEEELRTGYPRAYRYLLGHRDTLARRRGFGPGAWYALRSASCLRLAAGPRLLLKLTCSGGDFTIDREGRTSATPGRSCWRPIHGRSIPSTCSAC